MNKQDGTVVIFLLRFRMISLFSIFAVNNLSRVFDDFGDFAFGGQSFESGFGEGSSDLHSLGSDGSGDDLVAWDFLVEFVKSGLVKKGQVDELVSYFTFAPLLLFTFGAAHSGFGLGLFGFLDLVWHNL